MCGHYFEKFQENYLNNFSSIFTISRIGGNVNAQCGMRHGTNVSKKLI